VEEITVQLADLCSASAPLSIATVRCVIIVIIRDRAPEVFDHCFKDGPSFRISDWFCRSFLDRKLAWSLRKGTKAVQKLPANAEEQCNNTFLHHAYTIKDHRIPAELIVNMD
jgi:hypothetical protein